MSRSLIITGMHRSGTSLVSSLLQRAGVNVGDNLLAANSANPRGYFEDVDFYEFHEGLLHQRGQTYLHVDDNFTFEATPTERERAARLIAERSNQSIWGWKDPRTSLFLDFWNQQLPDSRFLFVFRHPIEVLLSLLRRGEFDSHPTLMAGLHAWYAYNSRIELFFDSHSDRCLLAHIDGIVQHSDRLAHLLRDKLQLDTSFNSETVAQQFHANEFQKTPSSLELTTVLAKLHPQVLELYQRLCQKADLPNDVESAESTSSPDLTHLAAYCDTLPRSVSVPIQYGLACLLISSLAPEAAGKMLACLNRSTKDTQQKIDYLWMEVQRFQRSDAAQTERLECLQALVAQQITELDKNKQLEIEQRVEFDRLQKLSDVQNQSLDNLQWLNMEQIKELNRQANQIESLLTELSNIHGTRIWKAVQSYRKLKERWKKVA